MTRETMIMIFLFFLINAVVLWVTANFIIGPRGCGSFIKCLIGSLLMPLLFITIIKPFCYIFRGMREWVLGGLFGVEPDRANTIFIVFLFSAIGTYLGLSKIGLDPVNVAKGGPILAHGGAKREEFRQAVEDGLLDRLGQQYNLVFGMDHDHEEPHQIYVIRPLNGGFTMTGDIDEVFESEHDRGVTADELADWIEANVREIGKHPNGASYLLAQSDKGPIPGDSREGPAPGMGDMIFNQVPAEVQEFYKTAVPAIAPDEETLAKLKNWQVSGADGLTSVTSIKNPGAWDLALSTQDLAYYKAVYDPARCNKESHRDEATTATEPNRVLTIVEKILSSDYGDIEICVEEHRKADTAMGDVMLNKIRLPVVNTEEKFIEVLMPKLTWGVNHYVSVGQAMANRVPVRFIRMEGYVKNIWFRITVLVQEDTQDTMDLLFLMNMQKLKIARMLGLV